jgi:hypothetical protein
VAPEDPKFSIVSGSASKMSEVGYAPGLRFARSAPGYMRLVVRRDGGMSLFVEAGPPGSRVCAGADDAERRACMTEGVAAFETVHSERLR